MLSRSFILRAPVGFRLAVVPRSIRPILVRDHFFGNARIPIEVFLNDHLAISEIVTTIANACELGADLSNYELRMLVKKSGSRESWAALINTSKENAQYVFEAKKDLVPYLAVDFLRTVPNLAVRELLRLADGDFRPLHSNTDHPLRKLSDWVKSGFPSRQALQRRKLLFDSLCEAIVANTTSHPLSKNFVGNSLNCTSCHLDNGRHPKAGTFLGTATAYPAWSTRENRVLTLEDRVLNCFMRSCNGIRPPLGGEESVAVTTYITSLSQGLPMQMNPQRPLEPGAIKPISVKADQADLKRGASLYTTRCAECHQNDDQGDEDNPPVWGDHSYNDGAGLSSVENLAP